MLSWKVWRRADSKRLPPVKAEEFCTGKELKMAYAAGVDVGSTQTKAVVINEEKNIVGRALIDTGANVIRAAEQAFAEALKDANVREEEVEFVVGTGYGRYRVTFGN